MILTTFVLPLSFIITHSKNFIVTSAVVTQVFNVIRVIQDGYDFDSSYCIRFSAGGLGYMTESTMN